LIDSAKIILEAKDIAKLFPKGAGQEFSVLEDINFKVGNGEFIALLGPSGAGKSTLLRILAGLTTPSKGKVLYHGLPLSAAKPRLGMVFQSFALFPWLTVKENVELGLKSKRMPFEAVEEKALKMLDAVGLDGFEEAYPRELSGGMRQRVGIARALVIEPELLLMDEPFSALDVLTADALRRELIELWRARRMPIKSIIMVTHNIEEAVLLADRALIMSHNPGRLRADLQLNLPHPRERASMAFQLMVDRLYTILTRPSEEIPSLIKPRFQFLPHVKVGGLAGLLELVEYKGDTVDIFSLASELNMEVDDIVPLMQAAAILRFGDIKEGDFSLLQEGKDFARADTLKRKEIFKTAAVKNIQLIKQILQTLSVAAKKSMGEQFFIDVLENYFTEKEAWIQLEIAIDWGRYGELFAYDYDAGKLYLEN
jgi:NitT/TauT family transport system ATP-binding protein